MSLPEYQTFNNARRNMRFSSLFSKMTPVLLYQIDIVALEFTKIYIHLLIA